MLEFSNIIFLGLFLIFISVPVIWYRRNRKFLTIEEKRIASSEPWEASWKEIEKIGGFWVMLIAISLFVGFLYILENFFGVMKASSLIFVFAFFELCRSVLRNHKIYKKSDLPQKFVRGELDLGVFILLAYGSMVVFIFAD